MGRSIGRGRGAGAEAVIGVVVLAVVLATCAMLAARPLPATPAAASFVPTTRPGGSSPLSGPGSSADPASSPGSTPTVASPWLLPPFDPAVAAQTTYRQPGFATVLNLPFTSPVGCGPVSCQLMLDAYVPVGPGPFPTVVLLRGGPSGFGGRAYLNSFAAELATRGVLVFNADYRDIAGRGGGYPTAFEDVACAVRFARSAASGYHGQSGLVTLVGHSLGGWVGSVVALDDQEFGGGCLAGGSGRPDAFVGLAGNYQIAGGGNDSDLFKFFGGGPADTAAARSASDPFGYAGGEPIPVRLVAGTADTTVDPVASSALDAFLVSRGWNVGLTMVPGGSHMSILRLDCAATWSGIFSAISAAASGAGAIDPQKARTGR